jgi:hypothetical protein
MPLWWYTKSAKQKSALSILAYKKNNICQFIHKWWKDSYVFSHTASHKSNVSQQISASFSDYCFWNVMPRISFQVFMASVTQMTVFWIFTLCSMMCVCFTVSKELAVSVIWVTESRLNLHFFPFRSSNWPNSEKCPTRQFQRHKSTFQTLRHCPQPNSVILNMKAEHDPLRHQKTLHYTA